MGTSGPHKVSIGGHVGSGKSSVARQLRDLTGWPLVSTGAIFRDLAARRDMSVLELNEYARAHPEVDDEVDDFLRTLAASPEPVVIDSRMAFHFVPQSLRCFLVVDPLIGAERIFEAARQDERYDSVEHAALQAAARQRSEGERYERLYGVDRDHWRNYDLVIDTTDTLPAPVVRLILDELESSSERRPDAPRCWLSPHNLLPTKAYAPPAGTERAAPEPITAAVFSGHFLIVDGHARVSAALQGGDTLIRAELAAFETEDVLPGHPAAYFARQELSRSDVETWEAAHGFRFRRVPDWVREPGSNDTHRG